MTIITVDGVEGKICSGECKVWKPLTEFTKKRFTKDGYRSTCKACSNAQSRAYYAANRERGQERGRRRYWSNPEKERAAARSYRDANPEKVREAVKSHHAAKRETLREQDRARYAANIEKNRAYGRKRHAINREKNNAYNREYARVHKDELRKKRREWERTNPIKVRICYHRRRTRERDNGGSFTLEEWEALKATYNYICLCCRKAESQIIEEQGVDLVPDHILPVSKGGSSHISNIQPLCRSCNSKKGTTIIDYRPKEP